MEFPYAGLRVQDLHYGAILAIVGRIRGPGFCAGDAFSFFLILVVSIALVWLDICCNGCVVFVVDTGLDHVLGVGFWAQRWQSWGGIS